MHREKPTISIIIINKNDGVAETLASLLRIAVPAPTETIVVDASAPDSTKAVREAHPEATWIQFTPKPGPKSSIPEQRNAGLETARGDILVFIDASCVPGHDWLVDLTAPIMSGREFITAGSVVSLDPRTHVNIQPPTMKAEYLTSCATINLAFAHSVYDHVGPLDESFHYGSDVDFAWRCINAGYKIRFVPKATVSHDWGDRQSEIKRIYKYGRAKAVLYAKHPDRAKPGVDDIFLPIYVTYILALPITLLLPWYPLTILLLMAKNWRHQPVKTVYMHLIFASGFIRQGAAILVARTPRITPRSA